MIVKSNWVKTPNVETAKTIKPTAPPSAIKKITVSEKVANPDSLSEKMEEPRSWEAFLPRFVALMS